jgi:hypothetical protein
VCQNLVDCQVSHDACRVQATGSLLGPLLRHAFLLVWLCVFHCCSTIGTYTIVCMLQMLLLVLFVLCIIHLAGEPHKSCRSCGCLCNNTTDSGLCDGCMLMLRTVTNTVQYYQQC